MPDHTAKAALYDALAEAAKALANGRRAELVDVLAQGERSVEELAQEIDQSLANTSQHLQRLLRAGLVRSRREGNRVHYALAGPSVAELWRGLRQVSAEHVAAMETLAEAYLGNRSDLRTMTREELIGRLDDVVVVDVRPRAEYAAGHIPGAVSIPHTELQERLSELPEGTDVVAYCRGPYCVYADDAVRVLDKHGVSAHRLEDGFPEWAANHLPSERGTPSVA
jgi:rhodanese-related sulfurtransferase/predicted transcriptional regulator